VEWVFDERVDLAIVHNPPRQSDLEIEALISERMVCVLPPEMTGSRVVTWSALPYNVLCRTSQTAWSMWWWSTRSTACPVH
jgi:DNA-binding transcriptional LysR family regulator